MLDFSPDSFFSNNNEHAFPLANHFMLALSQIIHGVERDSRCIRDIIIATLGK